MAEGQAAEGLITAASSGTQGDKRPRVLFVIDGLGRGGAERQARLLLTAIPLDRVRIRLACFGGDADELERVRCAGIPIDRLPRTPRRLWPLRVILALNRIIAIHKIRVVQAFLPTFDILVPCLRILRPGLKVVTSRRNVDQQLSPGRLRMVRWTNRLATVVVANSGAVAESVRAHERGTDVDLRVIPNGIELPRPIGEKERATRRESFGIAPDAYVLAYIAHFRDGKGHHRLPRLIKDLLQEIPKTILLVAGDTESNRTYRRNALIFRDAVASLQLDREIRCLGAVEEIRAVLAASDVVLNLSDVEGMSNALMEAMSLGLPIVASDAGGAREMIADGEEGWIFSAEDRADIMAALVRLARDPQLRRRAGGVARRRMGREFSVERMAGAYAELYAELDRR